MKPRTIARYYRWEAIVALIGARLAVRLVSARNLLAWADRRPAKVNRFIAYEASQVAYAVEQMGAKRWIEANCLPRALAAHWMLRRRGIVSKLCLGVAREKQQLSAHAWIELEQAIVVGGVEAPKYQKMIEFGGRTA